MLFYACLPYSMHSKSKSWKIQTRETPAGGYAAHERLSPDAADQAVKPAVDMVQVNSVSVFRKVGLQGDKAANEGVYFVVND